MSAKGVLWYLGVCKIFYSALLYHGGPLVRSPFPEPKLAREKKKFDQTLLEESQSVVWLLCESNLGSVKSKTKSTATATKPTKRKTHRPNSKPCHYSASAFAKLRIVLFLHAYSFVQKWKLSTLVLSAKPACEPVRLFSHFFISGNWNLVEQKSVLDCRRISRNFSQKRGQQKRPKTKKQQEKQKDPFCLQKAFYFSQQQQHTIINTGLKAHAFMRVLFLTIEIWLILPVVICLFQGLSHACLRITALQESAHGSLHQT